MKYTRHTSINLKKDSDKQILTIYASAKATIIEANVGKITSFTYCRIGNLTNLDDMNKRTNKDMHSIIIITTRE